MSTKPAPAAAAAKPVRGANAPKQGDRKAPAKADAAAATAAAPVPSGPTIVCNITNAAPAASGKSFLDAIRAKSAAAAPAAPAPAAAAPASTPEPVAETPAAPAAEPVKKEAPRAEKKKAATPAPVAEETPAVVEKKKAKTPTPPPTPAPIVDAPVAKPSPAPKAVATPPPAPAAPAPAPAVVAITEATAAPFSWATEEEIQFQIQGMPRHYLASYPESVTSNLATNITFRAPATSEDLASAMEAFTKLRASFEEEKAAKEIQHKNRDIELSTKEAMLIRQERQLHVDTEKLDAERIQLQKLQQQAQQQAQQVSSSQAAPQSAQQTPPQQQQQQQQGHPGGYMPYQDWTAQERWGQEMIGNANGSGAPGYEMYAYQGYSPAGPRPPYNAGGAVPNMGGNTQFRHLGGVNRAPRMTAPPYNNRLPPAGVPRAQMDNGAPTGMPYPRQNHYRGAAW